MYYNDYAYENGPFQNNEKAWFEAETSRRSNCGLLEGKAVSGR